MRRFRSVLPLACLASLALSNGCHTSRPAVAVLPRTTANLLWKPLHEGAVQASSSSNLSVDWSEPANGSDAEQQMQMYASLQNKGYSGFIFAPDETLAARTAVLDTVNRGTPVVIVDDELGPPPSPKLSYVTNDEAKGTLLAAQEVARLLHGRGNVAITGIDPRSEVSLSREENFEKAIAATASSIQIVERRFGDAVITHQQQIAQEMIAGTTRVDAIIALSSTSTLGAYYARLANPPRETIHIVGFDQESLLSLETGEIDAIVAQNTHSIGEIAMRNLARQIRGDSVPGVTLVSPLLLTQASLQSPALQSLLDFPSFDVDHIAEEEASLRDQARQRALRAGVQPISAFLMQPGRHPNVSLQGAVISLPPLVAIQDDTNALIIPHFHSNVPLKLDAQGYLHKQSSPEDIMLAIRAMFGGAQSFPRRIMERLANQRMTAGLSGREREVLELVAKGLTNKEVANTLRISQFTVRNHPNHIAEKLDVSDRTEAIFVALQTGLITLS